jgi:dipeptidyl aminopeptidase/acylaminoacyl peptidase
MRGLLLILTLEAALGPRAFAAEPRPIAEERFITLGGIPQWVTIRGSDRTKPVLLFLHGGPGDAQSSLTFVYKPFEKDFEGAGHFALTTHTGQVVEAIRQDMLLVPSLRK